MSRKPLFRKPAGAQYNDRLKYGPDVSVGVENAKKESFLQRIVYSLEDYSNFDEIFEDEEEIKLFRGVITEIEPFYKNVRRDKFPETAQELEEYVKELLHEIQEDSSCRSLQKQKDNAEKALADT